MQTKTDRAAFNAAKTELKSLGIILTYATDYEEYRVNLRGGKEATAYYASDLQDAVGTGKYMLKFVQG